MKSCFRANEIILFCVIVANNLFAAPADDAFKADWVDGLSVDASRDVSAVVKPLAPSTVFTTSEKLVFTRTDALSREVSYVVRDWRNRELQRGDWKCNTSLELQSLPKGYYSLTIKSDKFEYVGSRTFVVVQDPSLRKKNPDSFFALDVALSWVARGDSQNKRHPEPGFGEMPELIRRAGLDYIRERLRWADCERGDGTFDFTHYATNASAVAKFGCGISGVYHDCPKKMLKGNQKLSDDLLSIYDFSKRLAQEFRGKMRNWEFWNEMDGGHESAWDYSAAYKAAYLGFKAGDKSLPVLNGSFAQTVLPNYFDVMIKNDVAEYIDVFNVHCYAPIMQLTNLVGRVQKKMKENGLQGVPLWFTENGTHAEGPARMKTCRDGLSAHSPEQELIVAECLPKTLLTMQSAGVDRDFFFVLPPFNEQGGRKDWGLLRRDFTPKLGYAALANMTDNLGACEYLGEMSLGEGIKGFLYRQPDGRQTLAYWTVSEFETMPNEGGRHISDYLDRAFTLSMKDGRYLVTDIFGTPCFVTAENGKLTLKSSRLISYVNDLTGLTADKKFVKENAKRVVSDIDKTIVLHATLSDDFKKLQRGDKADVLSSNPKLVLHVWNLSDKLKTGNVFGENVEVTGLPGKISIAPFSCKSYSLSLKPKYDKNAEAVISFSGVFDGKKISLYSVPLQSDKYFFEHSASVKIEAAVNPLSWRENASGKTRIIKNGDVMRFETKFEKSVKDKWTYPELSLNMSEDSLEGVRAVSFEMRVCDSKSIRKAHMIVAPKKNDFGYRTHFLHLEMPGPEWRQYVVRLPMKDFSSKFLGAIRIGCNGSNESEDVTFEIRNLKLHK